mmetsp:Transcript_125995/g.403397  ORF Transcript_125995/g.403397 Transcript_125995/m.403397 type:complete len:716 (+) Transcript_125995:60-2207(+)
MVWSASAVAAVLVLLGACCPPSDAISVSYRLGHPIEKVIGLLKDLGAKAEAEGKDEEVLFNKFKHWCTNTGKTLGKAIEEEKSTIETLSSEVQAKRQSIEVLEKEIEDLSGELVELDKAAEGALKDRKAGDKLYNDKKNTLEDTIKAMGEAVTLLSTTGKEVDTGLVQARQKVRSVLALLAEHASSEEWEVLQDFSTDTPSKLKAGGDYAGHVKGYAFKSGSVVEMLKGLETKFEDELVETNTAETNAISAYQLAQAARDNLIKATKESRDTKSTELGETKGDLATASNDLENTQADLKADTKSLSESETACMQKQSEWDERSKTRALEIEAIEMAATILAKVAGVRTEAPSNPEPPPSPVALLQVSSPRIDQAVHLLRQQAELHHSDAIERLAAAVEDREKHGDGPFDQIINMVQKMIFQMMNEQTQEDDHKNWCDKEISKTQTSIDDKTDKVEELTLKIADEQARANRLAEEIREADDMVGKISAHMDEATEIREIGKQENKLAVKDAEEAQTALANAIAVLKDFYKKSGAMEKEAWEFIQAPVELPETPSTWDSGYTGVADPANQPGGIVAILETLASDFAKMEAETLAQESSDQEAFQNDMKDNQIEKARRTKESELKAQEQKRVLEKQAQLESTRKSVSGEKAATDQYMKDLHPACVEGGSTYEDRKKARSLEVAALKQAQGLLTNAFEDKAASLVVRNKFLRQSSIGLN